MISEWSTTKIIYLSKHLDLIGCHGNNNPTFANNI